MKLKRCHKRLIIKKKEIVMQIEGWQLEKDIFLEVCGEYLGGMFSRVIPQRPGFVNGVSHLKRGRGTVV